MLYRRSHCSLIAFVKLQIFSFSEVISARKPFQAIGNNINQWNGIRTY
uniref:Uncharacterized protein n=1 Tax=Anguilla anguilla TaxID=7936 RepID=A0A0E9XWC5_ANGAN